MTLNIPEYVSSILDRFHNSGFEAYCVGGCIRDSIMGKKPYDWDITTSALPEETKNLFSDYKTVDTGLKHGTVSLIVDRKCVEVTTYRTDGTYVDNRHPESVEFTKKLEDDLARRDFTINTIVYDGNNLRDLFGGMKDIENHIIKTVGDPAKRFNEDGLRIMRALRFSSVLGFDIEENTKKAIHENRRLLSNISSERLSSELTKMLVGKNIFSVLMEYPDVLSVFIPEIMPAVGFRQFGKKHAYDVWEHICHTVDTIPPDRILRLTMMLHDLGKIPTHKINDCGESTFANHASEGGKIAEQILTRLKFDKRTISRVSFLVSHHDFEPPESKILLKKEMKNLSSEDIKTLLIIKKSDRNALSEPFRDISAESSQVIKWLDEIKTNNECVRIPDLAVNGKDLIKTGLSGEAVGVRLEELLDAVIEGKTENKKSDLLTYNI